MFYVVSFSLMSVVLASVLVFGVDLLAVEILAGTWITLPTKGMVRRVKLHVHLQRRRHLNIHITNIARHATKDAIAYRVTLQ